MTADSIPENHPPENGGLPSISPDYFEQEFGNDIDNVIPTRGYQMTPMVGLGGSAGSIAALTEFFRAVPPESGMIFVVILHLSPSHHSNLPDVLSRATSMEVVEATDGQRVETNHVYVIPPGKHMLTVDGHLKLTELQSERGRRMAVDLFFRSLADTHGPHSAAIILSGADGDGAIGIKRVKERGGLTIAQEPDEAEYSGVPKSSIDTGMIDWVLRVAGIPAKLLEYFRNETRLKLPPEEGPQPAPAQRLTTDEGEAALRDVLVFLRMRTGRDFSYYKRATILRRIGRRMQVNSVDDRTSYRAYLQTHPGEAGALLQDLLISVTNFFRDRDAFEALEQHIPALFKNKTQNDSVRVWVPACATGEEAYSIAILLLEHARKLEAPPVLQVFACDLDDEAIQTARSGLYPETIAADVNEDRLRRFFIKDHRGYRVRRELREMVLFASHDLLKDAPFSRMDLISCRNLLIYLNREAQARVFETFHFALKPEGRLFLGSSEAVEDGSPLFQVLDKKHRIYLHQPAVRSTVPVPAGPSALLRVIEAHERAPIAPVVHGKNFVPDASLHFPGKLGMNLDRASLADLHFRLIERFAAPSVVVNAEHEVIHLSERAGEFLKFGGGEPSVNLLRIVHPSLRVELRGALFRAAESATTIHVTDVYAEIEGQGCLVDMHVSSANDIAPGFLLVVFDKRLSKVDSEADGSESSSESSEPVVRHIERELEKVKSHLRDTVEQYEASTEELKASNEELQAMNEELRSATEELETSREELQSINEELTTVNQEMKSKVDEVANANSDLQNLMASTSIATVFLDRDLAITRYTPSAVELFNLIPTDIGRPLAHLKQRLEYPELLSDAEAVLRTLVPVEREVTDGHRWYLARSQPYRTLEDHIAGVVLTFVNVTERKQAERAIALDLEDTTQLRKISELLISDGGTQSLFDAILKTAVSMMHADADTVQLLDPATNELHFLATTGIPEPVIEHFSTVDASSQTSCGQALRTGQRVFLDFDEPGSDEQNEANRWLLDAGLMSAQTTPLIARSGRPIGMLSTHWKQHHLPEERELRFLDLLARQAADAMERMQSQDELRVSEERLRLLVEGAKDYAIFTMDAKRRVISWNTGAEMMFGYSESEILGQSADVLFVPEDRAQNVPEREIQTARDEGRAGNERWQTRKNGSVFYGSGSVMSLRDASGELRGFVKIIRDLTKSKESQDAIQDQIEELSRFNAAAVGRELRMIELKNEVNELCQRLGEEPRYSIETGQERTESGPI